MKTIVIAHNYTESSFASMSYSLAHHLADLGNRVVFISHHPYFLESQIVQKEIGEIIVCSWPTKKRPTSVKDLFWYAKLYYKYKPSAIIGHFVGSNITVAVSKILSFGKVKTIEYYHTLSSQILTDMGRISLQQRLIFLRKKIFYQWFCDIIICPSELAKKDLKQYYGSQRGFVLVNPMADRFKEKAFIPQDVIVISYLGRLDMSKGVEDLILGFDAYKIKFKDAKIILNIAGTGSQGVKIKELAENNKSIHFFGGLAYDKIDEYLNKSHYVIIPSKYDNLPTVGLEALMNQTPLLLSNNTGLEHYLSDGKECFKFDPNADAINQLFEKVENNFNQQQLMALNARATFISTFTIERYCKTFEKIL